MPVGCKQPTKFKGDKALGSADFSCLPVLQVLGQDLDVLFGHDVIDDGRGDLEIGHGFVCTFPEAGLFFFCFSQE